MSSSFPPETNRREYSPSDIARAISYAIARGYEIAPDAVKLLRKVKRTDPVPEEIVGFAIEDMARRSIAQKAQSTITADDLSRTFPDLFEPISASLNQGIQMGKIGEREETESNIEIVKDPSSQIEPVGIDGFSRLFKSRYEKLMKIFRERPEYRQLVKTTQLKIDGKGQKVAGLVYSKRPQKNGIELVLDDDAGKISVLAMSDEAKKMVNQVSTDQCIMLDVEAKGGRFLLKSATQPDIPKRIISTSKKTAYVVFMSDLHIGSNKFLEGAFDRFLEWLAGRGLQEPIDEEIIRRLKYIVIGGDIVDGVGVFPNQEYELAESDIYKQYEMVSRKLSSIPGHLEVLIIPGNHDSTRQALPQPMIPRKYAEGLYNLKNVTMLGDPSLIKLHGVSILAYHGRSLDDVLATTPGLSYEEPTGAMKVLLRARHLAPMFGSRTPIAPEVEDHLVIEQVPDIFHTGHVHSVGFESYRSTLMINSGTWQAQTGYQKNLGIMPRPGLVPVVNLATFEVYLREFLTTHEPLQGTV